MSLKNLDLTKIDITLKWLNLKVKRISNILMVKVITNPTAANLGPLFDIGGARLNGEESGLCMIVEGSIKKEPGLNIESSGEYPLHNDDRLADRAVENIFQEKGLEGGLNIKIENNMKPGGVGASGARAVAIIEIINQLYGLNLTKEEKILYASFGEPNKHLDNVVPGVIGGIVVSSRVAYAQLPYYSRLRIPQNITPSLIVPLDIHKSGGTAEARKFGDLNFSLPDVVKATELAALMIAGINEDDFEKVRASVNDYSAWEKSVTYVRNEKGVYGINILELDRRLCQAVGPEAVVTPSGAGPAMLVLTSNPAVELRARIAAIAIYKDFHHEAKAFDVRFS